MLIQKALLEDAATLTAIAFASKRHWDYPETWIQSWANALTISEKDLRNQLIYKAVYTEKTIGFYALKIEKHEAELTALWVLPEAMECGIGRTLFEHAESTARSNGATHLILMSDPHAGGFYRQMGATVYGQHSAKMDDTPRFLPLMKKTL
tara:strand:- start:33 stop:485 length:453 start_codon:yes stop_codon:yes gene_type:complete